MRFLIALCEPPNIRGQQTDPRQTGFGRLILWTNPLLGYVVGLSYRGDIERLLQLPEQLGTLSEARGLYLIVDIMLCEASQFKFYLLGEVDRNEGILPAISCMIRIRILDKDNSTNALTRPTLHDLNSTILNNGEDVLAS